MLPWLFLLLAVAALGAAFMSTSPGLLALWLLLSLALFVAWVLGLLAQRVGSRSRDASEILDPVELRRLREQADARRMATDPGDAAP